MSDKLDISQLGELGPVNDNDRIIMSRNTDGQAVSLSIEQLKAQVINPLVSEGSGSGGDTSPTQLSDLSDVDTAFSTLGNGKYFFEKRNGIFYPAEAPVVSTPDPASLGELRNLDWSFDYISEGKYLFEKRGTLFYPVEADTPVAAEPVSLGTLTNVSDTVDHLPGGTYVFEMREGMLHPVPVDSLGGGDSVPTTFGELENVDPTFDGMEDGMYAFRIQNGKLYPVAAKDFMSENKMTLVLVGSRIYTVGKDTEALIRFQFTSTLSGEPTGAGAYTVKVKDKVVFSGSVEQGENAINVTQALEMGENTVTLTVTDAYGLEYFIKYTITVISLSLSAPNFEWYLPFGGQITVPYLISGSIRKRLVVSVRGVDNDYSMDYEMNLGTNTYTETAYNYPVPHPGIEGVFRISAYVSSMDGITRTPAVSFDVICVTSRSSKLMCVNNRLTKGMNWTENALFDFALFDGSASATSATFTVYKDGESVYESVRNAIPTGEKQTFSFPLQIDSDDTSDFTIDVRVADTNKTLAGPLEFPIAGSYGYSADPGEVLFINPKTRDNTQGNREEIINEASVGGTIQANWSNMNWGNDGWQPSEGTRALRILAGSQVNIDYKPFAQECARTGKTIEIDFKTDNVVDGTEAVISILAPSGDSYIGYRIAPEEITMFSQSKKDGATQHLPIDTGVRIRAILTIMPDAYGNSGFNLCCLYINGKKNRVFTYENNDYFAQQGTIVIGSHSADIDIYGIRVYDKALTSEGVQRNYVNSLLHNTAKEEEKRINDVLDINELEIDFENARKKYNCFVFDKPFPRRSNPSEPTGTLEVYYPGNNEPYCTVTDVQCNGQGTSSMLYYEWNVRFRVDKSASSVTTYADGTTDTQKVRLFGNVPKMQRITAKKNWASSMQDHKAGSVNAYNDLYKQLGYTNPAMEADTQARVAVYQEPFLGFSKELNEEGKWVYTCMGEFTMGPDKGDKACFGFNTKTWPNLLALEGADNAPLPVLFRVPWREDLIAYNGSEESFLYNGAKTWDLNAGDAGKLSQNISSLWVPAYNLVYECSNRIRPYNGTLDELNADVINHRGTGYEYWIAETDDINRYNLYYYEASQDRFVPSDTGNGIINLYQQLVDKGYGLTVSDLSGKSNDKLNELFIKARIAKFREEMPTYFDLDNAIFHHNFIEFIAGTDNRAKNTYAYHFGIPGEKWKWRQDDLDTIFPIDNQGQDKKPYYCEVHDQYANGAPMWNGETSNFWNLLELAFGDELAAENKLALGMKKMLAAMESLSELSTGTSYDKLYAFYQKYYLNVKNYFPATLVNADARRYENAKLAYNAGSYTNDTDPITQSHGDFYSAETAWVKKRILYMMSKYNYGTFSTTGNDTITVRTAGNEIEYELTPAMALYPAIASGRSIVSGKRTMAGEVCPITVNLAGSSDQQNTILGADNLLSIGKWHQKNVMHDMSIRGKRLQEITLGHKTEPVTISISSLKIANCPSVRTIELSNIATLAGVLDVSTCTHLKELYAGGTKLSQIKLPEGGGLEIVEFPATSNYLTLRNFPLLQAENVKINLCKDIITDFLVQDCGSLNPIDLLMDIMNAQASQGSDRKLERVRAVGFDATYTTNGSEVLDNLAKLADGSYKGLSVEGMATDSYPVLDGKLTIHADVYEDSVEILRSRFPKLELNIVGGFYLRFADDIVKTYFVQNFGDSMGVKTAQMGGIMQNQYGTPFRDNSQVTSFDEMRYMTSLTEIKPNEFENCTALQSVTLPSGITFINRHAFKNSGIRRMVIPASVTEIGQAVFSYCPNLKEVVFEENSGLRTTEYGLFEYSSALERVELPDTLITKRDVTFQYCTSLKYCRLPHNASVTVVPYREFRGCSSLEEMPLTPYIKEIAEDAFRDSGLKAIDFTNWNVERLTKAAFFGCAAKTLVLSSKIATIPYECFRRMPNLETVIIPDGVAFESTWTFAECTSLRYVDLPSTMTIIRDKTFYGDTSLETVIVRATTPPSLAWDAFDNTGNAFNIYVPDASVNAYKSALRWSDYATKILPLSQLG